MAAVKAKRRRRIYGLGPATINKPPPRKLEPRCSRDASFPAAIITPKLLEETCPRLGQDYARPIRARRRDGFVESVFALATRSLRSFNSLFPPMGRAGEQTKFLRQLASGELPRAS